MLQYFTETSESQVGYFQLWHHILRHLRHLLALCLKSYKPPFRLAQLIYMYLIEMQQFLHLHLNCFMHYLCSYAPSNIYVLKSDVVKVYTKH